MEYKNEQIVIETMREARDLHAAAKAGGAPYGARLNELRSTQLPYIVARVLSGTVKYGLTRIAEGYSTQSGLSRQKASEYLSSL